MDLNKDFFIYANEKVGSETFKVRTPLIQKIITLKIIMLSFALSAMYFGICTSCSYQATGNLHINRSIGISDSCKSKYIDYILKRGYSRSSYFLHVNIIDREGKQAEVVVANEDLFPILMEEQKMDEVKLNQLIKNSILQNFPLKLKKAIHEYDNSNSIFLACTEDREVERVAFKGSEYFIKYFYSGGIQGPADEIKVNYATVIKQLFAWNIPIKFSEGIFHPEPNRFNCP